VDQARLLEGAKALVAKDLQMLKAGGKAEADGRFVYV
jgi:hypothetical protein